MPPLGGNEWTGDKLPRPPWIYGSGVKVKALVSYISEALEELQGNNCIYCGMPFDITSGKQVEHIAPKGPNRYSNFTFHPLNLALACSLCNGFEKKERDGFWDTVENYDPDYESCTFKIVHPYFDNPENHIHLDYKNKEVLVSALSPQGQKTIDTFILDGEALTMERGKMVLLKGLALSPEAEALVEQALRHKGPAV